MKVANVFTALLISLFLITGYKTGLLFLENHIFSEVLFALAFLISWRFNKSASAFTSLIISAAAYGFSLMDGRLTETSVKFLFPIAALNILYLLNKKERGIFSIHGIIKTALISIQFLTVYIIIIKNPAIFEQTAAFLAIKIFKSFSYLTLFNIALLFVTFSTLLFKKLDISAIASAATAVFIVILPIAGISSRYLTLASLSNITLIIAVIYSSYFMSYIDELTKLPGRRAFNEGIMSLGKVYSIAMCDIDHFKKFNDTYGHDTGDEVLKLVAKKLSGVKGGGKTYRYGGEEFVMIFKGKDSNEAFPFVDAVRKEIESASFTVRNRKSRKQYKKTGKKAVSTSSVKVRITISGGIADYNESKKIDSVIKKADQSLYKAKKEGRNKVCF